jgi:hypothetical protein
MTKELLEEAYSLYQTLYKACWNLALQKQETLYARYKRLEEKALNRYERRYQKYTKTC